MIAEESWWGIGKKKVLTDRLSAVAFSVTMNRARRKTLTDSTVKLFAIPALNAPDRGDGLIIIKLVSATFRCLHFILHIIRSVPRVEINLYRNDNKVLLSELFETITGQEYGKALSTKNIARQESRADR